MKSLLLLAILSFVSLSALAQKQINLFYSGGVTNAHVYAWTNYNASTAEEAYSDLGELPIGISVWQMPIVEGPYAMGQLLILTPGDQFKYWECADGGPGITIWWDAGTSWTDCMNASRWELHWNSDFSTCEAFDSGIWLTQCDELSGVIIDPPLFQIGDPFTYAPTPFAPVERTKRGKGHNK